MKHMSLCTGYGGIDMALAEVFGAETVAVADIDKGACKILAHRYPNVPNLGDITTTDWSQWVGKVDIISGGTPCQDLSHAGRRAGMTEGTRSNLWVAMRESIATIRPALVVWENVRGAYSAAADSELESCPGCVGDGSGVHLRALGRVLGDLSSLGYDACWYGLRASDVGAAHHRYRVFVFAWDASRPDAFRGRINGRASDSFGRPELGVTAAGSGEVPSELMPGGHSVYLDDVCAFLPTTRASDGAKGGPNQRGSSGDLMLPSAVQDWREYEPAMRRQEAAFGRPAPLPTELGRTGKPRLSARFSEWLMGCPDGWITDTPGITRNEALKAAGNGVVPQQCAAAAMRFIHDYARLQERAA